MVICCMGALFVLLALLTYHPADITLNSASLTGLKGEFGNLMGKSGAWLADILFQVMGGAAFILPVYGFIYGISRFRKADRSHRGIRIAASILLVVSVAILLRLRGETISLFGAVIPAGGVCVGLLAALLLKQFSITGALMISITSLLVSLMLAARFSLVALFGGIRGRMATDSAGGDLAATADFADDDLTDDDEPLPPLHEPTIVDKRPAEVVHRTTLDPTQEAFSFADPKGEAYHLPPSSLLHEPPKNEKKISRDDLMIRSDLLTKKLLDFGVEGRVTQVSPGPVITMYEFEPAPGVKVNRIVNLADDLALAMRSPAEVRVSPLPGKAAVGIEIPNPSRESILLREIITSAAFKTGGSKLMLALGKDTIGAPACSDLAKMPHLLVAGTTGSGKSVGVSSMIVSILYNAAPSEVKFLMIDPKMVELAMFDGIPHLLSPVITDMKKAADALRKVIGEMERRYSLFASTGVRNIEGYNKTIASTKEIREGMKASTSEGDVPDPLPYIVVIIDELADLMMVVARDVEDAIARLAAKARAAGIHLIIATQRPSVDVITGVIKANLPTRISYKVSSDIDSKVILDQRGGKQLLGNGDMLFLAPGTSKLSRIHGPYISDEEIRAITDFIKQQGKPNYQPFEQIQPPAPETGVGGGDDAERDEMYRRAVELVTTSGQASISMLQRRLKIGYPRAGRIIEMMEEDGIVGPADGSKPRDVLIRRVD